MYIQYAIQTIVSFFNIGSVPLTRRGRSLGWVMVIIGQAIFAAYNIVTGQYFFLILNFGMMIAAATAIKAIRSEART